MMSHDRGGDGGPRAYFGGGGGGGEEEEEEERRPPNPSCHGRGEKGVKRARHEFVLGEWGGERAKVNPRSREATRERGASRETPRYELYPRVWPTTEAIKSPFLFILYFVFFLKKNNPIAIAIDGEIINGVGPPRP